MAKRRLRQSDDGRGGLVLYTDGALRPSSTGLGVVVRDRTGHVLAWRSKRLPQAMTCNEAEYEALLLGLETVRALRPKRVEVRMDSQVVINQMLGLFAVRNASLRRLHARARALVAALSLDLDLDLGKIEFVHVPRLCNRLADALANEAAEGIEIGDG
jgi:ribonuclease HI